LTLEAWVKTSADSTSPNYQNIIYRGDTWNQGLFCYTLRLADGKVRFDLMQSNGAYSGLYGATTVTLNVWHHVAAIYDGSQMRVYLDGALDGSQPYTWTPPNISTLFRIGRETYIYAPFNYNGQIDEVRVSAGARYTGNFSAQKHLTADATTKGLWRFDGQTANDSSGNGNNGTLNGAASYSSDTPTP
jgi:hypothetical protein